MVVNVVVDEETVGLGAPVELNEDPEEEYMNYRDTEPNKVYMPPLIFIFAAIFSVMCVDFNLSGEIKL